MYYAFFSAVAVFPDYTAISIYVVGSKPQAYKTRLKGNMGS